MERFYREVRRPQVEQVLAEAGGRCEFVKPDGRCKNRASDVHEKLSRGRGGGIRAEAVHERGNLMAICRPCHEWVTTHPREAEALGYTRKANAGDGHE